MATFGAEDTLKSEGWDQDELSEMKILLQRAEQRMRKLDPASKHALKATNSYMYTTVAPHPMLKNLIFRLDYPS